jgi:hypothetical protein
MPHFELRDRIALTGRRAVEHYRGTVAPSNRRGRCRSGTFEVGIPLAATSAKFAWENAGAL